MDENTTLPEEATAAVAAETPLVPTPRELSEKRADELTAQLGEKICCIVFTDKDGKSYSGYYKKANRLAAIPAFDLAAAGRAAEAGSRIFPVCFLAEYSDKEIETKDEYYITTCYQMGMTVQAAAPDIKKN